jgi:uncharacterized protein (DUF2126 family)
VALYRTMGESNRQEKEHQQREQRLAQARYWRENGQSMTVKELIARVKDVEARMLLGYRQSKKILNEELPSMRWEQSWREDNQRLWEYGKRLIKERGGSY